MANGKTRVTPVLQQLADRLSDFRDAGGDPYDVAVAILHAVDSSWSQCAGEAIENQPGAVVGRARRPRSRPAPAPVTPMAQRLEDVRAWLDIPSLREFHTQLAEGWGDAVSYEAVRTYHKDRDAPAAYLARIVKVFPAIELAFLVSGEAPMVREPGGGVTPPPVPILDWLRNAPPDTLIHADGLLRMIERAQAAMELANA